MTIDVHSEGAGGILRFLLVAILRVAWWIIEDPVRLSLWSLLGILALASSRSRGKIRIAEVAQTTTFQPIKVVARTAGPLAATGVFLGYWTILLVTALVLHTWLHLFELAAAVVVVMLLVGKRARLPRMLLGVRQWVRHPAATLGWRRDAKALRFDPGIVLARRDTPVGPQLVTSRKSDVSDVDLDDLAARRKVRSIRARRSALNANVQTFTEVRSDALADVIDAPPITELVEHDDKLRSTYEPIPWGVDEDGDTVYVDLPGEFHAHGLALASSRGGKTRWAWGVCAQHVAKGGHLVVLDGKDGLSFAAFAGLARCRVVGADEETDELDTPDGPILERGVAALRWAYEEQRRRNRILREVSAEHGKTYDTIRSALRDHVWPDHEAFPHAVLVVVDEAPWWTLSVDHRDLSLQIRGMLDTIASKGASAGLGLLLLTQRATITDSTLPARARDNVKAIRVLFGTPPAPSAAVALFGNQAVADMANELVSHEPGRAACTLAGEPVPIAARAWLHDAAWLSAALGYAAERHGHAADGPRQGPVEREGPPPPTGAGGPLVVEHEGPAGALESAVLTMPPKRKYPSGAAKRRAQRQRADERAAGRDPDSNSEAS